MRHGISEQEWLGIVDGTLSLSRAESIRRHALTCDDCAGTLAELTAWHEEMTREALHLRQYARMSSAELENLLADSLDRLAALRPAEWRPAPEWRIDQALSVLRSLMVPYCGPGAAAATIALATSRTIRKPETSLTEGSWPGFVDTLSDCFGSVCGLAAGRLVGIAGTILSAKEV